MKKWFERQLRKRSKVYLLPTKMGGYLNGLIFLMFLLSLGYNNNLLLIFTLILFGMNLIWVLQTHFHLNQLRLESLLVENGHALNPVKFECRWKKEVSPGEWLVTLEDDDLRLQVEVQQQDSKRLSGEVVLPYRGQFHWTHLKIATDLPFGLYQAWIYFPLTNTTLAYPSLIARSSLPQRDPLDAEGDFSSEKKGPFGIQGLDSYQGESLARISWKHYAKTGDLVVKTGEATREEVVQLELTHTSGKEEKEQALSELATSMVFCHEQQIPFLFRGKSTKGPGHHQELLRECLKELALC